MAGRRYVVAGGGVVGASIAYHLAVAGVSEVVLADLGTIASGASGKALGGVRQQFSSAPEVRLARESVEFFRSLGPELFTPVGYLFLATSAEGLVELERRRELQAALGVPVVARRRRHGWRVSKSTTCAAPSSAPRTGRPIPPG